MPFQQRELGYFDSSIILQEFLNGSSIIMKHIDRRFPAVAALKNKVIEELFPYTVQANAYLAPSDTQGVQIHADPHATLLIQCSGKKRWLVWGRAFDDTQESLLESLDLDKRVNEIAKGQPIIDEFVHEGDILYIPKGYVHTPFTSDTHSLHLTLGIQTNSESSLAYTGKSIPNDNNVSYSCKDYMLAPYFCLNDSQANKIHLNYVAPCS
ncbi:JmjC domain-containing protein [Photobacterium sp. GB-3]|uniref:JmjC domain-containing protein n=1 Tax=Photobacterium sp. GB-3 TaxID=2022110 RepID=UPI0011B21544|nr:cupin domain-containing protein [Photobacterium sp. GB-3]